MANIDIKLNLNDITLSTVLDSSSLKKCGQVLQVTSRKNERMASTIIDIQIGIYDVKDLNEGAIENEDIENEISPLSLLQQIWKPHDKNYILIDNKMHRVEKIKELISKNGIKL